MKLDENQLSPRCRRVLADLRQNIDRLTQRQLAEYEKQIWDATDTKMRKLFVRHAFFHAVLPATGTEVGRRAALLAHGSVVDALWQRIDAPKDRLSISGAVRICRDARTPLPGKRTTKGSPLTAEMVEAALRDYDSRKAVRCTIGPKLTSQQVDWGLIRAEIEKGIFTRLNGDEDPFLVDSLCRELEHELKGLILSFGTRISMRQRTIKDQKELSEATIRRRCINDLAIFGLILPRRGKPFDIKALRRNYRKQAAAYHPDRHPDDIKEAMQEKFRTITQAYERLLAWHHHTSGNTYPQANTLFETDQAS